MSGSEEELMAFIRASFPSVWALELLLAMKRDRRLWSRAELVSALRASELVIVRALDALVAAGLASFEQHGVRYIPANDYLEGCVEQVEELYRSRPNSVRRVIVATTSSSASAFADAFRLWKGRDG